NREAEAVKNNLIDSPLSVDKFDPNTYPAILWEVAQSEAIHTDQPPLLEIPEQLLPFIATTEVRHWTDVPNGKAATPPNTSIMDVRLRMETIQAWLLSGGAVQMQAASLVGMDARAVLYLHDMTSGTDYALTATQQEHGHPVIAFGLSWNASADDARPMVSPIDLQSLMDGGKLNIILDAPMPLETVVARRLANVDPASIDVHPLDAAFYQQRDAGYAQPVVIGLQGDPGAGKDTVADMLVQDHGFLKLSFGDVLYQEVAEAFRSNVMVNVNWLKQRDVKDTPQLRLAGT
ncbi:AAA family ATPase, partial [Acidithiobacillus ferrivorans]|nr:AAA family ATPase [Acidithiobacillus ferrivorans]